jgi:4-hydroxybenzoyl-CoA thioesterase
MTPAPSPSSAAQPRRFVAHRKVRFGDCDPAGIVYYPRYFDMLNGVIEDWWQEIGLSWSAVLPERDIVTPVSHLETQFLRPSTQGDLLDLALTVESVSRSSIRLLLRVTGAAAHEERLSARARMVCVAVTTRKPRTWPSDIHATLAAWRPLVPTPAERTNPA